jgi:hypothetical protein
VMITASNIHLFMGEISDGWGCGLLPEVKHLVILIGLHHFNRK